jgi:group I intron endonuclease
MKVHIYGLFDPKTKEIRYIGKSIDINSRFRKHLIRKENNHKASWIASLKKDGLKPEIEVLETIEDSNDQDWQKSEEWWIAYFRFLGCRLTNLNNGGRGGILPSDETRQKMSASHIGKTLSPEVRKKISAANKGKKKPDGFSEILRIANTGRAVTDATKRKLSAISSARMTKEHNKAMCLASKSPRSLAKMANSVRLAHQRPEVKRRMRIAYDKRQKQVEQLNQLGEVIAIFPSTLHAAAATGANASHIGSCALGRKHFKTARGFLWRFSEIKA